jgi:acyl-coenzyme A thioesterase PaaI-like protein
MTLLDAALGLAAMSPAAGGHRVVTVSLTTQFVTAPSGPLVAEGRLVRAGRSLAFCEGEVRDGAGNVAATALGTFKIVGGDRPAGEG